MDKNLQILVSGCSFSESQPGYDSNDKKQWKPWSDFLSDEFVVKNVAKGSMGNFGISKSIVKEILGGYQPDLVIIQWSGIARRFTKKDSDLVIEVLKTPSKSLELVGLDLFSQDTIDKYSEDIMYGSLQEILLVQEFLEKRKIPYLCFWGWQEVTYYYGAKTANLFYNDNWFLLNDNNLGFREYTISNLGEDNILDCGHPNTDAHKLLYEKEILPRVKLHITKKSMI
tara:strand:+ start:5336 stop:6016 length:681 start_codon:yes stop_codon:yes gene_type:complete